MLILYYIHIETYTMYGQASIRNVNLSLARIKQYRYQITPKEKNFQHFYN